MRDAMACSTSAWEMTLRVASLAQKLASTKTSCGNRALTRIKAQPSSSDAIPHKRSGLALMPPKRG